tara:strand:+ start:262 stop:1005 length:744 start_codon:yes stop_codon:yes gene_type:complete
MRKKVKIKYIKPNTQNPRTISKKKFNKLVKSIIDFPEMLEKRPLVVDENMVVLGGNMRLKALQKAGFDKITVDIAQNWTEEQKQEFIIKDNISFGDWDWDSLGNEWLSQSLDNWGLEIPSVNIDEQMKFDRDEIPYTSKINAPIYKPSDKKPDIKELIDKNKYKKLLDKIKKTKLSVNEKNFLMDCATRHMVFDYTKIADYYAHSPKEIQDLMEESALIIIDFDKAIKLGYIQLRNEILDKYLDEYQ